MAALMALQAVTVDCPDPRRMADFYRAAAGAEIVRADPDSAWVRYGGTLWIYRRDPDHRPPTWPAGDVPMRVHAEFAVAALDAAEQALTALGATTAAHQPGRARGLLVMLDPAGHPFCIGAPPPGTAR